MIMLDVGWGNHHFNNKRHRYHNDLNINQFKLHVSRLDVWQVNLEL